MTLTRREFVECAATFVAGVAFSRIARSQEAAQSAATNAPMNEGAYRAVRLPAKSEEPSLTAGERDELEHKLHCQCGCNLDVYTCRTTDFSCPVSPAMHRDVMALVAGGYGEQAILDAFTGVYGEQALMAPKKEGFNWAAYVVPFAALGAGAVLVTRLLRGWRRESTSASTPRQLPVEGTPDELAQLDAAIRSGDG